MSDADRIVRVLIQEIEKVKSSDEDSERDALLVDLHACLNLIGSRAGTRAEARERAAKHAAIIPECREALERFESLNAEAERHNSVLAQARKHADDAESKLNLMRDRRPAPYPTQAELSEWEQTCKALEAALEAARAEVRGANARRAELTRQLLQARNRFNDLKFRERNLLPRAAEPYRGSELSGVR